MVRSGTTRGSELGNMEDGSKAGPDGPFFLALSVEASEEPDRFTRRMDGIIRQIRAARRVPWVERLSAPGHLEAESAARHRPKGIPRAEATLAALATVAGRFPVGPSPRHGA